MKQPSSVVTVKDKFQIVIPQGVRRRLGISRGDILEAKVERGKLTYVPKVIADRAKIPGADDEYTPEQRRIIDAQLKEAEKGPFYGPFETMDEFERSLRKTGKQLRKKAKPSDRQ